MPRLDHPDLPAPRRRRRLQGLRSCSDKLPYGDAHAEVVKTGSSNPVAGGTTATFQHVDGRASGELRRLPRSEEHGAARDAARRSSAASRRSRQAPARRRTSRASSAGARQPRHALRSQRRRVAAGDALVRLRPVPRRVLLRPEDHAVLSRGTTGLKVEQIESYYDAYKFPDGHRFYDWTARRDRRRGAQGAASRVRDVEPGHPRAQRRRVRRLPHALQARGRDEGLGPLGPQPAAQYGSRACQVCHPYAEAEIQRARRGRSRIAPTC